MRPEASHASGLRRAQSKDREAFVGMLGGHGKMRLTFGCIWTMSARTNRLIKACGSRSNIDDDTLVILREGASADSVIGTQLIVREKTNIH